MLFNSLEFLIFFPIVTLLYFVIPHRFRYIWLLLCSYYFYMQWNQTYALLMFASTLITYLSGAVISHADSFSGERKKAVTKKLSVAFSFITNLSILFFFKYFDFVIDNINAVLHFSGSSFNLSPAFDVLLPVGISFYTFQALSYTMDIYRKDVVHEKNFLKYALFVSFFPQLVAGPIERSSALLHQISEKHSFDSKRVSSGLMLMLWGFFEKLVIADRAAFIVDNIYNNYESHYGFSLIIATILFAFQIYCDFASYSDIARGAAEVMGFKLMKNFDTPYFSKSVSEFWRRWHISLSSWFKDYLYIPLGGNRKGKLRKYFNLIVVFFVSGLWHGANWTYVIWGLLNGVYQVIGDITKPLRNKISSLLGNRKENFSSGLLKMLVTFILIDISWIFFRAESISAAFTIIRRIPAFNPWIFTDGTLFTLGLDSADMLILMLSLVLLFAISVFKYKKIALREWLSEQGLWFRFSVYLCGLFAVLIFGIYGSNYDASQFIYFQF